jgi:nicotinamide-nucleotide amidase
MQAEILATGDEIRTGALIDSNSAYIAEILLSVGLDVVRHSCVGDELEALVAILREIGDRSQFCVVTGGLGPTVDDLSSQAAAMAADVELIFHEEALRDIQAFFDRIGRTMNLPNRKQAYLPKGSDCLRNPVGTAPGFSMMIGRCRFCFLPGVPKEMKRMMAEHVVPIARQSLGAEATVYRIFTITTFGLTESGVDERLTGFAERFPELKLGMRAKFPEIQVKLYGQGTDPKRVDADLSVAAEHVRSLLGPSVISMSGESMAEVVGRLLRENGKTLSLAESCTGGLLADLVTSVSGSSDYFLFSGVTYSNQAKTAILKVNPDTIRKFGAVSEETAGEMALGAKAVSGADYALSTSGIAGPTGGTPEKPVGTVCIGVAGPGFASAKRYHFKYGGRDRNKTAFAVKALDLLRQSLITGKDPFQS